MYYRVMIVDDEAIILSGIKSLINWEENGCEVTATARNGKDALEQMRAFPPDIVLADINMPVMDGVTLMKKAAEEFPQTVFIILTNLGEFELARQSLQYKAVDYILKSQIEAEGLEAALEAAKAERRKREWSIVSDTEKYLDKKLKMDLMNKVLLSALLFGNDPGGFSEETVRMLTESGFLESYRYFYIPFVIPAKTGMVSRNKEEKGQLIKWLKELASKAARNVFKDCHLLLDLEPVDAILLFVWQPQNSEWEKKTEVFSRKLASTIRNLAQTECTVMCTQVHSGISGLADSAEEYQTLLSRYYLEMETDGKIEYESLELHKIGSQLYHEILRKNTEGIREVISRASERISTTCHQKSQAVWVLNEITREMNSAIENLGIDHGLVSSGRAPESISKRSQVLSCLEHISNTLCALIGSEAMTANMLAEQARRYIQDHIEGHISLQEAAEYTGVSPGYLSTVFKKTYNQSFIDYANMKKMEHACRLLEKPQMMIMDVAYRLNFENAYYFSKVFRKYMGVSPSNYRKRCMDEKNTNIVKNDKKI